MQIVIDIKDAIHRDCKEFGSLTVKQVIEVEKAIKNGIPLPEGHGRLIDADALKKFFQEHAYPVRYDRNSIERGMSMTGIKTCIEESVTIVEADKEACK